MKGKQSYFKGEAVLKEALHQFQYSKSHNNDVIEKYLSWQVETVGDKYMTVSGLPEPCMHHARSICHLALDMMEIAGQVQVDGEPVQVSKMWA